MIKRAYSETNDFCGDQMTFLEWIASMENYCHSYFTPDNVKVGFAKERRGQRVYVGIKLKSNFLGLYHPSIEIYGLRWNLRWKSYSFYYELLSEAVKCWLCLWGLQQSRLSGMPSQESNECKTGLINSAENISFLPLYNWSPCHVFPNTRVPLLSWGNNIRVWS